MYVCMYYTESTSHSGENNFEKKGSSKSSRMHLVGMYVVMLLYVCTECMYVCMHVCMDSSNKVQVMSVNDLARKVPALTAI